MRTKPKARKRRVSRALPAYDVSPAFLDWISETRIARFALLLIDLDEITAIRETLDVQDCALLLRHIEQRIRRRLRGGHLLRLPRAGCFAAVVRDPKGADDLARIATQLLEDLRRPHTVVGAPVQTTASIGLCVFPEDGESLLTLLRRADLALNRARQRGGNAFEFYDRGLNSRLRGRWDLSARLWRAYENEEFTLAYQPLVNAETGAVCGAEALLRWQDAERGPQSPAQFVPLLEQSSLIVQVGEWVLRTACREARRWLELTPGRPSIAVNLSPRQFEQPGLVSVVRSALDESGLPPELLILEITENELMRNPAQARVMVQALHAMGVRVVIDDFGTGYSSIGYLKHLPVAGLKIDRSFVAGLPEGRSDVLIAEMIITLAARLNLEVVAEGVETEAQAAFMRSRGVQQLQGYLFGKPAGSEDFLRLLDLAQLPAAAFSVLTAPLRSLQ